MLRLHFRLGRIRPKIPFAAAAAFGLASAFCAAAAAAEVKPGPQTQPPPAKEEGRPHPAAASDGVPYDYRITDGLYATLTAESCFKKPSVNEEKIKLRRIPGFRKELEVRLSFAAKKEAPLVVLLLGLSMAGDDDMARLWQHTLSEGGCHVATFDSVFRASFAKNSHHGVTGYPEAEAQQVAIVVKDLLARPELKGRVQKLGFFGGSYGGIVGLNLGRLLEQGKVAFDVPVARILCYSPPASLETAANRLDRFYKEDRPKYQADKLMELPMHSPDAGEYESPFEADLMRAGIAYHFRDKLYSVVKWNNEAYELKQLERLVDPRDDMGRGFQFEQAARTYNFREFTEKMVFPYWQAHGGPKTLPDFWASGSVAHLLPQNPPYTRVVLTRDDPLNEPDEVKSIEETFANQPCRLVVHDHGGHLGYVATRWARHTMVEAFK